MEPKQILSANLLDIIFDGRNKAYGAYDLRVTYPQRIKKSLLLVFAFALLAFTGFALANTLKPKGPGKIEIKEMTLSNIEEEEKKPEEIPQPKKPEVLEQKTQAFVDQIRITPEEVVDPPPTQEDLADAKIDVITKDGITDQGIAMPTEINDGGTKIIEESKNKNDEPFTSVEVDARYDGNWSKFLLQNLNPNTPVDNGAPVGRYQVIVQFVVDLDGKVSDIKALTSHGYGMEEEAVRVIKRAKGWIPAFQNGTHVKAYRKQPIVFEVQEN